MEASNESTLTNDGIPLTHTPGPWYVNTSTPTNGMTEPALAVFPAAVGPGTVGSPICKVSPESTMNQTDIANATLIAAAPDLLFAARRMFFLICQPETTYSNIETESENLRVAICMATLGFDPATVDQQEPVKPQEV